MDAYVVNAFTDNAFGGNPAGVVLLDAPAEAAWMQSVAEQFKHAETAFVVQRPAGEAKPLRWFTPTTEVDLCGHATLAAAHVLGGDQRFATHSGELTCSSTEDGIELDFPADVAEQVDPPEELAAGLPGTTIERVARGGTDVLVQLESAAQVRALQPDMTALEQVAARGVIVTARSDADGVDFVSRFFAPRYGVPEDPVTGSAHCTLAPWWSTELDRTGDGVEFTGEQVSARGGVVKMTLTGSGNGSRIRLRGNAVTFLRGQLMI